MKLIYTLVLFYFKLRMVRGEEGKSVTETRFKFLIQFMRVGGIPIFMETQTKLYKAYQLVLFTCTITTIISSWLHLIYENTMNDALKIILLPIAFVFVAAYSIFIRFDIKSIEKLLKSTENFTWEEMPSRDSKTGNLTAAGALGIGTIYFKRVILGLAIYQSLICVIQFFMRVMFFPSWYPYDACASLAFELTFLSQLLGFVAQFVSYLSFFASYCLFVAIGCSQCDKINTSLLSLNHNHNSTSENHQELCKCIILHQQVIESMILRINFRNREIKSYKITLVNHGLSDTSVVNLDDRFAAVQALATYVTMSISAFLVCWPGTKLSGKVESVKTAVYDVDWIGTPISFQKSLLFITKMADKPFKLTGGKIKPINNETLMDILNNTYVMFTFLLNMQNKQSEKEV
ncbi:Odorant receptor 97 [Blattella germanica]|nr:Odorant receptor 97 [Blattella germanica]